MPLLIHLSKQHRESRLPSSQLLSMGLGCGVAPKKKPGLPGPGGERCAGRRSQLVFRNRRWSAYAAIICGQSCKRDSLPSIYQPRIFF